MKNYKSTCELVNTYEILEHIMGIDGLHPHSLETVNNIFNKVIEHTKSQTGVLLDIGCGSGAGTYRLSKKTAENVMVIGIDINKASIEKANANYSGNKNLSFYHGTIEDFKEDNPNLKIIGILSISVSMFLPSIENYYQISQQILSDNGIFVDAPFVFKSLPSDEDFKLKTYNVCGCNMVMDTSESLGDKLIKVGFENVKSESKEFELMNLKILFKDYKPKSLFSNFAKNILTPPEILKHNKSTYLFKRTLGIFIFFLRNKNKYGAGIIVGYKKMAN